MNAYANSLKETLTSLIQEISSAPAPYVKNPDKDFTRKKKLPFETVMQLLISMGGNIYIGVLPTKREKRTLRILGMVDINFIMGSDNFTVAPTSVWKLLFLF